MASDNHSLPRIGGGNLQTTCCEACVWGRGEHATHCSDLTVTRRIPRAMLRPEPHTGRLGCRCPQCWDDMTHYCVMGFTGKDRAGSWFVKAFDSEEQAIEYAQAATRRAREIQEQTPAFECPDLDGNEYDPHMEMDWRGTLYYVVPYHPGEKRKPTQAT